mmetsp:Transcript_49157/g.84493  ORF Transcript_49157/g.84493 Transcript_49157/m.84493 type:complete len:80 (+) Transcript_49157:240-479(+)
MTPKCLLQINIEAHDITMVSVGVERALYFNLPLVNSGSTALIAKKNKRLWVWRTLSLQSFLEFLKHGILTTPETIETIL